MRKCCCKEYAVLIVLPLPLAYNTQIDRRVIRPMNTAFKEESFKFQACGAVPEGGCVAKAMSEAQFLAGEDAREVIVVLEPETPLGSAQIDALVARGALGFVSDFTEERFERPDEIPDMAGRGVLNAPLLALAVSPRSGVRLRTLAGTGFLRLRIEETKGTETTEGTLVAIIAGWTNRAGRKIFAVVCSKAVRAGK